MRVTRDNIHEAFRRVLTRYDALMEGGVDTVPVLLRMAMEHIFLHEVPENDDTRLIRQALLNLMHQGAYADDDIKRMEAQREARKVKRG